MIIQGTGTFYPYLRSDKSIVLLGFFDTKDTHGLCLVGSREEGIEVSFEADFKDLNDTNKAAIKCFDGRINEERARSENRIAHLKEAKQKFLAIGVQL